MKIEANGEEKISVTLTKTDMSDLDITYDDMDYANIETRRVIWTILDEAKKVLGKPINIDNLMLIQVSPAEDGGCLLQFTKLAEEVDSRKKRLIMKKEGEPFLFCPFDYDSFLDSISLLKDKPKAYSKTEVFKRDDKIFTVIYPQPGFREGLSFALCEYGEVLTDAKNEIAMIYEKGYKLSS